MAGLRLGGLASGMDTDMIITQLMSLERQPRTRLVTDQSQARARQDGLKDVESRLKTLRNAAQDLGSVLAWAPTQTAGSSSPTTMTARLTSGAAPGGYSVSVTQMATSAQQTFTWTPQAGPSQVTVNGVSIDIDPNADLDKAASQINSSAELGVFAVNVGGKLVLSSRTTGAASNFTASGAGMAADPANPPKDGQDASLSINGATPITSASNVVKDAIPGVELTLKALGTSTVNVSPPQTDRANLLAKVKSFVSAYNDVVDFTSGKLTEKKVPNATTNADAIKGVLFGDRGLGGVLAGIRVGVSSPVAGMTTFKNLSELGISTGATTGSGDVDADAVKGRLKLDESKLNAALDKDPLAVQKLLGGVTGTPGFAQAFAARLEPLVQAGGVLDQRVDTQGRELKRIADAITRVDDRLERREAALRKQFTALESALSRANAQGAQLAARLGTGSGG